MAISDCHTSMVGPEGGDRDPLKCRCNCLSISRRRRKEDIKELDKEGESGQEKEPK